ncbi:uronyl 2-sulfotransferase-like isoform X2 [Apostichopus japonicus]|uniref:uronyl 2-sulfotransferase-like isoform X2 n=1 Tax=Stichopus japonicus TaxID=307972 RepID=UPI003AB3374C
MTSLNRISWRVAVVLACISLILFYVVVVNTSWKYDRQEQSKLSQTFLEVGNGATWKAKSNIKNISVKNSGDRHFSLQKKLNDNSTNLLGKVKRGKKHILIYNNVPKCGSRSLAHSIRDTLKRNGNLRRIEVQGNKMKGSDLSKSFRGIHAPSYISGHMPFVVPSRENIVYINMVRDPVQRFISGYYFAINGDEGGVKAGSKLKSNRTIDEYIKDGGAVTSHIFFHFDRYDLYETANNSDSILQRSKANIDKYFILVGLTEELEATVVLLQKLLPDLLHGLHRMYKKTTAERRSNYSTLYKVPPSNQTIEILKEKLKDEFELYLFVKQRFEEIKRRYRVT